LSFIEKRSAFDREINNGHDVADGFAVLGQRQSQDILMMIKAAVPLKSIYGRAGCTAGHRIGVILLDDAPQFFGLERRCCQSGQVTAMNGDHAGSSIKSKSIQLHSSLSPPCARQYANTSNMGAV
jgi:hypothetical protein